ncbi:hypothetical protein [Pseudoteredinibacter isoporae]|uniref:Uncharacterized protein n=1 Tax=Pseudoteredinibacter isoporae TaxID=570281 RepID=A0A7X0MUZ3_9GAMM|nr:hypothetical protein [Pseudoteredinibacter isoporae]MBB6520833.1 hypothetical protein [Pseudoteredinibacter isoporae]NHO86399.1 hypothetical protein [Pseudoteredinibacter isoporae]NIB25149.1 hypothetical protein [Pseudoteredinibacter isoporae]
MIRNLSISETVQVAGGCLSAHCEHDRKNPFGRPGFGSRQMPRNSQLSFGGEGSSGSSSNNSEKKETKTSRRSGHTCDEEGFYKAVAEDAIIGAAGGLAFGLTVSIATVGAGSPSIAVTTASGAAMGAVHGAASHLVGCSSW